MADKTTPVKPSEDRKRAPGGSSGFGHTMRAAQQNQGAGCCPAMPANEMRVKSTKSDGIGAMASKMSGATRSQQSPSTVSLKQRKAGGA